MCNLLASLFLSGFRPIIGCLLRTLLAKQKRTSYILSLALTYLAVQRSGCRINIPMLSWIIRQIDSDRLKCPSIFLSVFVTRTRLWMSRRKWMHILQAGNRIYALKLTLTPHLRYSPSLHSFHLRYTWVCFCMCVYVCCTHTTHTHTAHTHTHTFNHT